MDRQELERKEQRMENKKITFTIDGRDYERLMQFQEKHADCLEKFSNMTAAHYKYTFIPDAFGTFKTCTCCCGDCISLTADYNADAGDDRSGKEPKFEIFSEDKKTEEILRVLFAMEKRPGMYFGKNVTYSALCSFLAGYGLGTRVQAEGDEISWSAGIESEVRIKLDQVTKGEEYTEEELFYKFFEVLHAVLEEKYPVYLK